MHAVGKSINSQDILSVDLHQLFVTKLNNLQDNPVKLGWKLSHCLHQPLRNNAHGRNGFNGLCTKCPGYNNNLVITAHFNGTKGVIVNKFDCATFMY